MKRLVEWAVRLAVWLVAVDFTAFMLGVDTSKAIIIGFIGVVAEELLSIVRTMYD